MEARRGQCRSTNWDRSGSRDTPPDPPAELSLVRIRADTLTDQGVTKPGGSLGTVVAIWRAGEACEIAFAEPVGALATIERAGLAWA